MTSDAQPGNDIFLHIGTMKSGTSYIQAALRRNKKQLNRDGVVVARNLVPAVVDVLGRRGVGKERDSQGAWAEFLRLVDDRGDRAVIASQEFLSGATEAEAKHVVETLPEGKVKVLITNRDLLRVIPSHWQTVVKNGGTWPFPEYIRLLLDEPTRDGAEHRYRRGFWRHHDIGQIVDNWAAAVGIENVILVTVPPSGSPSSLLWERFAASMGLDGSRYDEKATAKSNVSLTYAETEMLREVNTRVKKPLGALEYRVIVNKYLANKVLRRAPETGREPDRPTVGEESHDKISRYADRMLRAVEASGVRIEGDINELRVGDYTGEPGARDSTGPKNRIPESVPDAIAKLVLRIARAERDLARLQSGKQPLSGEVRGKRGRRKGAKARAAQAAAADEASDSAEDLDELDEDFEATSYDDHDDDE